jgi:anthranilate synthase component 1
VGFLGFGGTLETAITIRTLVVKDGIAHVTAGAGIVADSVPRAEYVETLNKARAAFRALEVAEQTVGLRTPAAAAAPAAGGLRAPDPNRAADYATTSGR